MPAKSIFDNCYSEETYKKKMRDFNRFINSVLENPLLRSNELVEQFLTKNPEEFHVIKLKYKNLTKLVSMHEFHSLTGDLDVTFYPDEFHSSSNILENVEKKRNILKEINLNMKNAINCMENLNKYLGNLSKLFFNLEKEYENKNNKFDALSNIGRLFQSLSTFYLEKKNILDFEVREFFKYINLELNEIKNMCKDSKYAKINFEKCENILNNFKNDKNNINKNSEMFKYELQKKQIEKSVAKRACNFLRNRTFEELERIMNLHSLRIKKHFSKVGKIISDTFQKEYSFSMQIINCF